MLIVLFAHSYQPAEIGAERINLAFGPFCENLARLREKTRDGSRDGPRDRHAEIVAPVLVQLSKVQRSPFPFLSEANCCLRMS